MFKNILFLCLFFSGVIAFAQADEDELTDPRVVLVSLSIDPDGLDQVAEDNSRLGKELEEWSVALSLVRAQNRGRRFVYQSRSFDEEKPDSFPERLAWENRFLQYQIDQAKGEVRWLQVITRDADQRYNS